MHKYFKVLTGLGIFFLLVTMPMWMSFGKDLSAPELDYNTQAINSLIDKKCVEDTQEMRENHMVLLGDWRDQVVREGNRNYTAKDGRVYLMSLQNTCLDCHSNKEDFCDRCHDYVSVSPDCWTCHIEPGVVKQ